MSKRRQDDQNGDPGALEAEVRRRLELETTGRRGKVLLAAVSGGIDSMVLLDVLVRLQAPMGYVLHAVHLDHAWRDESAVDAAWVVQRAAAYGVRCHSRRVDAGSYARTHGLSFEAAGRQLRYDFFDAVARKLGGGFLVTGHHADDQAETVLMRLLRGSGAAGLAAMRPVSERSTGPDVLRPMLGVGRMAVETYARLRGIPFRQDPSNRDTRFVRNRVRHELLPHLRRAYNPGIDGALRRTADILGAEDAFLAEEAQRAWDDTCLRTAPGCVILAAPKLLNYHIAIQRRLVRQALLAAAVATEALAGTDPQMPDFASVEAGLLAAKGSGMRAVSGGLWGQRVGERLIVRADGPGFEGCKVDFPGEYPLPGGALLRGHFLPAAEFAGLRPRLGAWVAAFDAERLRGCLLIRRPQAGDRLQPQGMRGRKKISDLLVDAKWPRVLRSEALLLSCDGEVAWAVGLRPAEGFKVVPSTQRLLLLEIEGHIWDFGRTVPPLKQNG